MNIDEIVKRPSPARYTEDELIYVVEAYIKEKTGAVVEIDMVNGAMNNLFAQRMYMLLDEAFGVACGYFINK